MPPKTLYIGSIMCDRNFKIGHDILYNSEGIFPYLFFTGVLPIFSILHFTNILHCVLELTKMSIQLMDTVVCNELPVFLLYFTDAFFTVFYGFELLVHSFKYS